MKKVGLGKMEGTFRELLVEDLMISPLGVVPLPP